MQAGYNGYGYRAPTMRCSGPLHSGLTPAVSWPLIAHVRRPLSDSVRTTASRRFLVPLRVGCVSPAPWAADIRLVFDARWPRHRLSWRSGNPLATHIAAGYVCTTLRAVIGVTISLAPG
jgi:hypothetical protein